MPRHGVANGEIRSAGSCIAVTIGFPRPAEFYGFLATGSDAARDPVSQELPNPAPSDNGCHECLRAHTSYRELRICQTCGHVGCCDSSPNRHATKHFHATRHPIIKSFEPGEEWGYCYVDQLS